MFLLTNKKITLIRIYRLILNGAGVTHLGMVVQLDQDGCCLEVVKHILFFGTIKKLKGIENCIIEPIFQEFIKSVLILSYRKSNSKASPQKLYSEFLILKRWFSALYVENIENVHPCQLSTLILNKSFEILIENSSKTNLPDHAMLAHTLDYRRC